MIKAMFKVGLLQGLRRWLQEMSAEAPWIPWALGAALSLFAVVALVMMSAEASEHGDVYWEAAERAAWRWASILLLAIIALLIVLAN